MKDNLTFITNRQLGWTTRSYFIEGCITLFEISNCFFGNVGDLRDFRERVLAALDQPQDPASSLRSPFKSLHDVIDQL